LANDNLKKFINKGKLLLEITVKLIKKKNIGACVEGLTVALADALYLESHLQPKRLNLKP
jgi:hypothetical protein